MTTRATEVAGSAFFYLFKLAMFTALAIVTGIVIADYTQKQFDEHGASLLASADFTPSLAEKDRQLRCLARNIYFEGANEPVEGKIAIAQVTMNRVAHENFPNDVCSVVHQKFKVAGKYVCQFSWVCVTKHKPKHIDNPQYTESLQIAKRVFYENYRLPGLTEALYYHATYVRPNWRRWKTKLTKIGLHIFYKEREA
jgi:spore germination cell wall hydrolase CwlJ-like protein